jgi:fructose-bisphosphate aldolase class I
MRFGGFCVALMLLGVATWAVVPVTSHEQSSSLTSQAVAFNPAALAPTGQGLRPSTQYQSQQRSPAPKVAMFASLRAKQGARPFTPKAMSFSSSSSIGVSSKAHFYGPSAAARIPSSISARRSTSVTMMATPNAAPVYDGKYAKELRETANAMVAPGKGLLACDESTGTIGTRLEGIGLENNEKNRQEWRNLLFTAPGINEYISGAILFEETLFQNDPNGKPFVEVMKEINMIPGIKVDTGLKPLLGGGEGENWCSGLDTLAERAAKYYEQGARFAKWRTALKIDVAKGLPTDLAIDVASQDLARYARICQENGLVPIVEPEILIDGDHDIGTTCRIQERILSTVYNALHENGVLMEGSLLKPSMTVPGVGAKDKSDPGTIAKMTVQTLDRCLPSSMPGVTFLSGGISEEDSSIYLNEINKVDKKGSFATTFSYSRALQSSCIKMWGGKEENYKKAQEQLVARARANSKASLGEYVPGSEPSDQESLFVKDYVY